MTEQDAQESMRGSVVYVAYMLELPELGPTDVIIDEVTRIEPAIGALLREAHKAYEDWWNLAKRSPGLSPTEKEILAKLILNRKNTGQKLTQALANRNAS